ncbi:MAG TPA: hypothetical protein VFR47_16685 [Anaerolineales bacterium]|nr:hypothetical protein [Anaerolineales bacterium]
MKKTDKLLIGIVAGILLLVLVAFGIALTRPKPTYQAEDKPEGVAFNYLFALQQEDYERAYGYLSPTIKRYPRTVEKFRDQVRDYSWNFRAVDDTSTTLEVDSVEVNEQLAYVGIRETQFYEGDLFSSSEHSRVFEMTLRQDENGQWKIVESDSYWVHCWSDSQGYGCP